MADDRLPALVRGIAIAGIARHHEVGNHAAAIGHHDLRVAREEVGARHARERAEVHREIAGDARVILRRRRLRDDEPTSILEALVRAGVDLEKLVQAEAPRLGQLHHTIFTATSLTSAAYATSRCASSSAKRRCSFVRMRSRPVLPRVSRRGAGLASTESIIARTTFSG